MGDRMKAGYVELSTTEEISTDKGCFDVNRIENTWLLIQQGDLYSTLRVKFNELNIIKIKMFKLAKDGTPQMD